MNSKIIKEIFIIALLFMVIVFAIAILFYDCIPNKNEKFTSISYQEAADVKLALAEITTNSGEIVGTDGAIIKSYSVNQNQEENESSTVIESGKKDPFANYDGKVDEEVVKTTEASGATVSNSQSSTPVKVEEEKTPEENKTKEENEVKNTVSNNVQKDNSVVTGSVNNTIANKNTTSTTGTYFEKPNSK